MSDANCDARYCKRYVRARCDELVDELTDAEARVVADTARIQEIKVELNRLTGERPRADDYPEDAGPDDLFEVECKLRPVKAALKVVKGHEAQTGEPGDEVVRQVTKWYAGTCGSIPRQGTAGDVHQDA